MVFMSYKRFTIIVLHLISLDHAKECIMNNQSMDKHSV